MRELLDLARELADKEVRPRAEAAERESAFPREVFRVLGVGQPEQPGPPEQPERFAREAALALGRVYLGPELFVR